MFRVARTRLMTFKPLASASAGVTFDKTKPALADASS
jgi:hypothetical protein